MSNEMSEKLSPAERVEEWEGLYEAFRKENAGSPGWYHVVDYMVGALIQDHIEWLRERAQS